VVVTPETTAPIDARDAKPMPTMPKPFLEPIPPASGAGKPAAGAGPKQKAEGLGRTAARPAKGS
jgi:hypothetical protein